MDLFSMVRNKEFSELKKVANDSNIKLLDEDRRNLLHEAIAANARKIAKWLIDMGIDVNKSDNKGYTPLHFCGEYNNASVAKAIIERGGDVNKLDKYGNGPLWTAVFNAEGDYELVKVLLDAGANHLHVNSAGRSPLRLAETLDDTRMVKMLKASKNTQNEGVLPCVLGRKKPRRFD